jgi:hypothetical protein
MQAGTAQMGSDHSLGFLTGKINSLFADSFVQGESSLWLGLHQYLQLIILWYDFLRLFYLMGKVIAITLGDQYATPKSLFSGSLFPSLSSFAELNSLCFVFMFLDVSW